MKKKPAGAPTKKPAPAPVQKKTFADRLEAWLEKNKNQLLWAIITLSVILGATQFNYRISEANDDSMYLEGAFKFAHDFFGYYTANAPFYPMLLSLIIRLFGFKLILLKLTGFVFMVLHLYFLFRAFEKRIPYSVLFFVLAFNAINPYMLYYASMTFTEQFFMMQQAIFLYLFFKASDNISRESKWNMFFKLFIPCGFSLFILSMSRNVALGILVPVIVYFLIQKNFKAIAGFISAFLLFRIPFEFIQRLIWKGQDQFSNQVTVMLKQKDPYDPSQGTEDLAGFIDRFTGNYGLYISKRFYQILGFLSYDDYSVKPALGFLFFIAIILTSIYILRNKNNSLLFTWLYTGALVCMTFITVQLRWDQLRLILVFVPLILILFFAGFNGLLSKQAGSRFFIFLLSVFIFTSVLISTAKKSFENLPIVQHNMKGDMYFGYTPDWQNYLKMSRWCADSLPKESMVACRKAPMSFIYGNGKEFYPVYQVISTNPDSVLTVFKENRVTHVMLASLRRNPKKNDGYIINTIHRMLQPVFEKYPSKLTLVHHIGESEPAYLYKINY